LYFGEFGNNEQPLLNVDSWVPPMGRPHELFVAMLPLPFSTTAQRCALRNELIQAYNPISQADWARMSTRELARKLDMIEVRQEQLHTQIVSLLHHLNQIVQPQQVPPRRPIGFIAPFLDSPEATAVAGY
jgi:hypothetical protein